MSNEDYSLHAFWRDRKESLDECARRACEFFQRLTLIDSLFAKWWKPVDMRKRTFKEFEPSFESLRAELQANRNRGDWDGSIIQDLGFYLRVSTEGKIGERASVSLCCGSYPGVAELPVPNKCAIELPERGRAAERILTAERLTSVLEVAMTTWDADWGRVTSRRLFGLLPDVDDAEMVGWITGFSDRFGSLPPLPAEYQVRRLERADVILIKTQGRFTVSNPAHVEAARRLVTILRQAGKLVSRPELAAPERKIDS